jgi:hypothetical protein
MEAMSMHRGGKMNPATMNVCVSKGPGRPKKVESGQITSTADAQVYGREGLQAAVAGQTAISPWLLSLDAAAAYLSMSPWTIRDPEAKGVLPRVRVPLPTGGELWKLLFDKADLDRLITAWKETAA